MFSIHEDVSQYSFQNNKMVHYETDDAVKEQILRKRFRGMISRGRCPSIKRNQPCYADVSISEEFTGVDGYQIFMDRIESTGGLYIYKDEYPQIDKDILAVYGQPKSYAYETIVLLDGVANRAQESMIASERQVSPLPDENGLYYFRKEGFETYEEALAKFCSVKTERWLKLIDERMGLVPDFVLEAMRSYDVYLWNGLDRSDYEGAIA